MASGTPGEGNRVFFRVFSLGLSAPPSQPARRFLPAGESMMDASAFFAADASACFAASASASATSTPPTCGATLKTGPSIAARGVSGRSSARTPRRTAVLAAAADDDDDVRVPSDLSGRGARRSVVGGERIAAVRGGTRPILARGVVEGPRFEPRRRRIASSILYHHLHRRLLLLLLFLRLLRLLGNPVSRPRRRPAAGTRWPTRPWVAPASAS